MRMQRVNPNRMSQTDLMNNQSMAGMASLLQMVGKGKRKYNISMNPSNKKFLGKMAAEMKKQMAGYAEVQQTKGVVLFLEYLETESKNKNMTIPMSHEEVDFLRKTIVSSVKQMEIMEFKWYQFFKKMVVKMMVKQNKLLVEDLNR
jgi:hypothetical protein